MRTAPIVVVGMGLAGTRCATTLRRLLPERPVVLVGDESHAPYERPPLSKEFLARARDEPGLTLPGCGTDQLRSLGIDVRVGAVVAAVERGSVKLGSGEQLAASAIVLATGARPRTIGDDPGVHALRTLDDARRLRDRLAPGVRLAIVGSGFVGAEVASTARAAGVHVTIVEAESVPFARTLGPTVGTWLTRRWHDAGVRLHLGRGVEHVRAPDGGPARIGLEGGRQVVADEVLVAIGTVPRDELFHAAFPGHGFPGRGIPADASGRTPVDGIWTAGDVALVASPGCQPARRVEHWTDAARSAAVVAQDIASAVDTPPAAPYAWSDQFGVRLQVVGHPAGALHAAIDDHGNDTLLARYLDEEGRLHGVAAVGHPARVARYRAQLAA